MNPYAGGASRKKKSSKKKACPKIKRCPKGRERICVPNNRKDDILLELYGQRRGKPDVPEQLLPFAKIRDKVKRENPDMPFKDVLKLASKIYQKEKKKEKIPKKKYELIPSEDPYNEPINVGFTTEEDEEGDEGDEGYEDSYNEPINVGFTTEEEENEPLNVDFNTQEDELKSIDIDILDMEKEKLDKLEKMLIEATNDYIFEDITPEEEQELLSIINKIETAKNNQIEKMRLMRLDRDNKKGSGFYGMDNRQRYIPNYYGTPYIPAVPRLHYR